MSVHVISRRTYLVVFAALMLLLGLTFVVDWLKLGPWTFAVSLAIAAVKAVLIGIWFMHLRFSSALSRIVAVGGLIWLGIMLTFTLSDYTHRSVAGGPGEERTDPAEVSALEEGRAPAD